MTKNYDVVVIGGGVAGVGAAALLAKDFNQKVLVLEKAPYIGGRLASFVGKGDKMTIDGLELDAEGFKRVLEMSRCWVAKCTPDLETCMKKGLFDGYTFDNGAHGLFWGNKGRGGNLLKHLGVEVDIPVNTGFVFIDWKGGNKAYQVGKGEPYRWMSEEGFNATMRALRDMGRMSFADVQGQMNTDLQSWLEQRGMHPEAYDFIKVLAASQTGQAEPRMTPAGDFLGQMCIQRDIKMNLVTGSVGTVANPGPVAIPLAMEKVILDNGGEVWRNSAVTGTIIEKGRVRGVNVLTENCHQTIHADKVICTIQPKYMFSVIHPRHFPAEFVKSIETEFWGVGLLSGMAGLKSDVWAARGIEEKSFIYMPAVIEHEGYIGCVDMVYWNLSSSSRESLAIQGAPAKGRAPGGKRDFVFSTALTEAEMRSPQKVNRIIEFNEAWFKTTFGKDTWDNEVEFILWTPCDEALGWWRPVGKERPDVACPYVEGLYFAGDQYGERNWSCGVETASLSAVMCVDSMMGSNIEETFVPYNRGLPKKRQLW